MIDEIKEIINIIKANADHYQVEMVEGGYPTGNVFIGFTHEDWERLYELVEKVDINTNWTSVEDMPKDTNKKYLCLMEDGEAHTFSLCRVDTELGTELKFGFFRDFYEDNGDIYNAFCPVKEVVAWMEIPKYSIGE